jgi:Domain of unknown function (DUF4214)
MLRADTTHQARTLTSRASAYVDLLDLDAEAFIDQAYIAILKRPADATGAKFYLDRLLDGVTKEQIIDEIGSSEEAVNTVALGLTELLRQNGQLFIESSYHTLLGRLPDFSEAKLRADQLLNGVAKIQILDEIASSAEGMQSHLPLPGLHAAVARYKLAQKPIQGIFTRLFNSVEGNSEAEIRIRAIEQHVVLFGKQMSARVESLEHEMISLVKSGSSAPRQDQPRINAAQDASPIAASASAPNMNAPYVSEAAGLNKVPVRTLEMYVKLRVAATRHARAIL